MIALHCFVFHYRKNIKETRRRNLRSIHIWRLLDFYFNTSHFPAPIIINIELPSDEYEWMNNEREKNKLHEMEFRHQSSIVITILFLPSRLAYLDAFSWINNKQFVKSTWGRRSRTLWFSFSMAWIRVWKIYGSVLLPTVNKKLEKSAESIIQAITKLWEINVAIRR